MKGAILFLTVNALLLSVACCFTLPIQLDPSKYLSVVSFNHLNMSVTHLS